MQDAATTHTSISTADTATTHTQPLLLLSPVVPHLSLSSPVVVVAVVAVALAVVVVVAGTPLHCTHAAPPKPAQRPRPPPGHAAHKRPSRDAQTGIVGPWMGGGSVGAAVWGRRGPSLAWGLLLRAAPHRTQPPHQSTPRRHTPRHSTANTDRKTNPHRDRQTSCRHAPIGRRRGEESSTGRESTLGKALLLASLCG